MKKVDDRHRNLGVLYTAYLDKRNPITGAYKKRFVVLTHEAIHWFQRAEGYDLFGEERGHVSLGAILSTRIIDEDSNIFEIHGTDTRKRLFRATSPKECEEWVSAIRSAIKVFTDNQRSKGNKTSKGRRPSLSGIKFDWNGCDGENEVPDNIDVNISLVSLYTNSTKVEIVVARNPAWDRIIDIANVTDGDQVVISLSNDGTVILTNSTMEIRAEEGVEFDVAVQGVALASSLRVLVEHVDSGDSNTKSIQKNQKKHWGDFIKIYLSPADDHKHATSVLLSVILLVVLMSSLGSYGEDTFLVYLFATLLAGHQIYGALPNERALSSRSSSSSSKESPGEKNKKFKDFRISILGHAFTSPDARITEEEELIPQRFLNGCDGDMKEARRRWDITKHWREAEGVNTILQEPQPHFHLIKSMYPHYHAGRGKEGHVVFYERDGHIQVHNLAARGIKVAEMLRHWIFQTEYHWAIVAGGDDMAKSISVMDLDNLALADMAGSNLDYVKGAMGYANQHYPERSYVVFIVNAPWYFSIGWKMVKAWVHPNTQKKIKILSASETLAGLQEHIDISQIPVYYGGQLDYGGDKDNCRFKDPVTTALNEYVDRLNGTSTGTSSGTSKSQSPTLKPFGGSGDATDSTDGMITQTTASSIVSFDSSVVGGSLDPHTLANEAAENSRTFVKRVPANGKK